VPRWSAIAASLTSSRPLRPRSAGEIRTASDLSSRSANRRDASWRRDTSPSRCFAAGPSLSPLRAERAISARLSPSPPRGRWRRASALRTHRAGSRGCCATAVARPRSRCARREDRGGGGDVGRAGPRGGPGAQSRDPGPGERDGQS
jgi:hypothetical protein